MKKNYQDSGTKLKIKYTKISMIV